MIWQNLNSKSKGLILFALALLGVSLGLCDQVLFAHVLEPEFGLLIFFIIEFGFWGGLSFSLGFALITCLIHTEYPLGLYESGCLLAHCVILSIGNVSARYVKYIDSKRLVYFLLMIFTNVLLLLLSIAYLSWPIETVYKHILGSLTTQSFFMVLTYAEIAMWTLSSMMLSLLTVFVIILSFLHTSFLGLVFITAYLFNYYFKGFLVSIVCATTYTVFAMQGMTITTQYAEILSFIALFIAIINLFKVYKDESEVPVDLNWLVQETESLIHEIAEYKQLAGIINYSDTVAFLWDLTDGRSVEYVSQNAKRILGYHPNTLVNNNFKFNDIIFADDLSKVADIIQKVLTSKSTEAYEIEYRLLSKSGEINWVVERSILKFTEGEVTHIQGTLLNITKRKNAEERLHRLTNFDELTGVHNRVAFIHALQRQIESVQSTHEEFAVFHIDIDQFKQINENFGYDLGDQVMCTLASRLEQVADQFGVFFSRMANNNFNVLCSANNERAQVELIAEQLLKTISEPVEINNRDYTLSASIGICVYPNHGLEVNELIANAEIARRKAQEFGHNNYMIYDKALSLSLKSDIRLIADLKVALEKKQFRLLYQPKVDLKDNSVVGAEALLRWEHPERGLLTPDKFINIAEVSGIIVELTEWILIEACQQLRDWQECGFEEMVVAVNLSARQFWDPKLVEVVSGVLEDLGVEPRFLELEITESLVMRDPEQSRRLMQRLRALGVFISVDDFGVGQSSLHQLKHYPFDIIKIDRSFVSDIPDDNAIIKAIVDMGHSLDLKVVAEGIETSMQLDYLRVLEGDYGQGFFFAKPLDKSDFEIWYKNFN